MIKRAGFLTVALALLMSAVCTFVPSQQASASTNKIVYVTTDATGNSTVSVNPDGTDYVNYGPGGSIRLSPDGTKVAFVRTVSNPTLHPCSLMVANVDGTGEINTGIELTCSGQNAYGPAFAWSPDSTKLVYSALNTPNGFPWSLHIADADGSNAHEIVPMDPNYYNDSPTWSPDGKKILYAHRSVLGNGDNCLSVLYVDSGISGCIDNAIYATYPSWSPDSTKIVYEKSHNHGSYTVTVANADGSNKVDIKTLTNNNSFPRWSPDGSRIAYLEPVFGDPNGRVYLDTINPDGTNNTRLLLEAIAGPVDWSPDSSTLIFESYASNTLHAIPASGGPVQDLFSDAGGIFDVTWGGYPQPVTPTESTAPLISYILDRQPNAFGWYTNPVTVTFNCTDDVSVATCTSPVTLSVDGAGQTVTGMVTDTSGKVASTDTTPINIDSTVPTATNLTMSSLNVHKNKEVTISANANDNVSGIWGGEYFVDNDPGQGNGNYMAPNMTGQVSITTILSLSKGNHTMFVRVRDNAGNWSSTVSIAFTSK